MRVLFISSSLPSGLPTTIVNNQAKSLEQAGITIEFFLISSKGYGGYMKEIFRLREFLGKRCFDICHAHYGLSAIVATFAGARPLVVSLMGSDVKEGGWQKYLIKLFARFCWIYTITKSGELANMVGSKYCTVIPNGVDFEIFKPIANNICKEQLSLKLSETYILFAANPERPEKNFALINKALKLLNVKNVNLIFLKNVSHEMIPLWLNASDVIVLSSLWEGSPNVIKEAMACNRPVVSTVVGDVKWLFGDEPGHFIAGFEPEDAAQKLKDAISFAQTQGKTRGRDRLISLELDEKKVAARIKQIYINCCKKA